MAFTPPSDPLSDLLRLERINFKNGFSWNATGQTRLSALASIAIEKELLIKLKQDARLHEEVIEHFLQKDRRMDFLRSGVMDECYFVLCRRSDNVVVVL